MPDQEDDEDEGIDVNASGLLSRISSAGANANAVPSNQQHRPASK